MHTLAGAEGGVASLDDSVVSVSALLVDALSSWSSAWTVNTYVVDGARRSAGHTLLVRDPMSHLSRPARFTFLSVAAVIVAGAAVVIAVAPDTVFFALPSAAFYVCLAFAVVLAGDAATRRAAQRLRRKRN
jgi:acyl-homoserine lactone acylase PvdQ